MLDRLLISSSARKDPNFNSVTLLLHGDGSNGAQNNTFLDSSSNNLTVTRNGNVTQGSFSPFSSKPYSAAANGGSMYFDGAGDWLTVPYTTANFDWYTSGTDFTIEAWFYANTLTNTSYPNGGTQAPVLCGNRDPGGGTDYWSFGPTSEGIVAFYYFSGSTQRVVSTTTVSAGAWTHIAMTKTSSGITLFVNGTAQTTTAISGSPQSSSSFPFAVGQGGSSSYSFPGYISGLRVVRGTAVYSGNFTPPTAPATAITNTTLLLNGTNAAIFDSAADNNLETVGNAQVSTSVKKFGTGSMAFDGSGDYLFTPLKPELGYGTGDFTIEFWAYPNNSTGVQVIVDQRAGSANRTAPTIYLNGGALRYYTDNADRITGGSVSASQWSHIALSRSGSSTRLFINGTQTGSTITDTRNYIDSPLYIGEASDGVGGAAFNGFIDEFRITKGVARYTANFTPPAAPFPDQ